MGRMAEIKDIISEMVGEVKFLDEGSYSMAFRHIENPNRVFLTSELGSYDKECLYNAYDGNPHLPVMEYAGDFDYDDGAFSLYETVYSEEPEPNSKQYALAKKLNRAWLKFRNDNRSDFYHEVCFNFIRMLEKRKDIPKGIIDALDRIYTWAISYDESFLFEFPVWNLGVKDDVLVLRDVLYFV